MLGLGLRQVKEALDRKADSVQRQFIELGQHLDDIGRQILEAPPEDRPQLKDELSKAKQQQQSLADEINHWRELARSATSQPGEASIRAFLEELHALDDPILSASIQYAFQVLDDPQAAFDAQAQPQSTQESTVAGRLLERARFEYDMRSGDVAFRLREAINFANTPGMAQSDELLAELEAGIEDPDPIVSEVALLTTIQLHRFRALRFADLQKSHQSVQFLSRLNNPSVIPVLVEVVETPRSGYGNEPAGENGDLKTRMMALLRLVEWHTPEAYTAVYQRKFDREAHIARAADRALELFPPPWSGPMKRQQS